MPSSLAFFFNGAFEQGAYRKQALGRAFWCFFRAVDVGCAIYRFREGITRLAPELFVGHFRQAALGHRNRWPVDVARRQAKVQRRRQATALKAASRDRTRAAGPRRNAAR